MEEDIYKIPEGIRSIRRHHITRIKNKVKKYYGIRTWIREHDNPNLVIGYRANTHTPCSCVMCGNPRKHFGERTISEIRHIQIMKDEIDEIILDRDMK